MKRFVGLLLILMLLLGSASAQMTAEKVYEVNSGEFLKGTGLMAFRNEAFGLAGIMAPDGTEVVPAEYLDLRVDNTFGYIAAAKEDRLNGKGMIDAQGNVLIPFEYGELDVISRDWVMALTLKEATKDHYDYQALFGGYGSGYYLIDTRTFYYMPTLKAVGTMPRDGFDSVNGYPGFLVIEDIQGVNTVYDENFQVLGTAEKSYYGYVYLKNGDNWDVKRAGDGKLLFSTPYQVNQYMAGEELFKVSVQGKNGLIDLQGNVIVEPKYATLYGLAGEHIAAKLEQEGKIGLLNSKGEELTDFVYDEVIATYKRGLSGGMERVTMVNGYAPVNKGDMIGFIDETGKETVAPTYPKDSVEISANTLLIAGADGKKTLVAADGTVTELSYPTVTRIYDGMSGRLYAVKNEAGQVGVVDWHGNLIVPLGDNADYSCKTSLDGSMLMIRNNTTRMTEVYKIQ